jgi:hypothetical protein
MTRDTAYRTKIEKALADLHIPNALLAAKLRKRYREYNYLEDGIPTSPDMADEFEFVGAYHAGAKTVNCQLCGHKNLKRVFQIKSKVSGKVADIGSSCVHNYLEADIIDGLCKLINVEYLERVNPIKFEAEIKILEDAIANNVRLPYSVRGYLINGGSPESALRKIKAGKSITKREKEVFLAYTAYAKSSVNVEALDALTGYYKDLAYRVKLLQRRQRQEKMLRIHGAKYGRTCNPIRFLSFIADILENEAALIEERKKAAFKSYVEAVTAPIVAANNLGVVQYNEYYGRKAAELLERNAAALNYQETKFLNTVVSFAGRGDLADWAGKKVDQIEANLATPPEVRIAKANETKAIFDFLYSKNLNYGTKRFIDSVYGQYRRKGSVSPKQFAAILKSATKLGYTATNVVAATAAAAA